MTWLAVTRSSDLGVFVIIDPLMLSLVDLKGLTHFVLMGVFSPLGSLRRDGCLV